MIWTDANAAKKTPSMIALLARPRLVSRRCVRAVEDTASQYMVGRTRTISNSPFHQR
jgi:hypothetical protein